ncbi:MAG: YrdB family protein [Anaerolineaceae bacterium]|nr:YrdB family protein [Anaerolineaceae bacterium]
MGSNPINLTIRFLLELSALFAMGVWGWQNGEGSMRFVFAIGIPLIAAAIWGIFRVPNDPGAAPVAIPGKLRLAYEIVFFGFATWALMDANYLTLGWAMAILLVIHYIISYDRILWMIKQN